MRLMYYIVTTLLMLLGSLATQAKEPKLPDEEIITTHVCSKVKQMCDYIEFFGNPQNSREVKAKYMLKALRLFLADCEPYEEDGIQKKGVEMEITSTYRTKPRRCLMKDYFTGLMNMRYSKVDIKSSDIHDIQVSKLKPISENTYVSTATFVQVFTGYKDGKPIYSKRTKKNIKCYVLREETMDGEEYMVKLGDTKALETKRI